MMEKKRGNGIDIKSATTHLHVNEEWESLSHNECLYNDCINYTDGNSLYYSAVSNSVL